MQTQPPTTTGANMDDLMPPDIQQQIEAEYRAASREVLQHTPEAEEEAQVRKGRQEGEGQAVLDGAPKPVPGDELAATVYGQQADEIRHADASRGIVAGLLVGEALAAHDRQQDTQQDAPQPAPGRVDDPMADMTPNRPNYAALRDEPPAPESARARDPMEGMEPSQPNYAALRGSDMDDLMPSDIQQEVKAASREVAGHDAGPGPKEIEDLMPPDIRQDVAQEQALRRGPSFGL